MREPTISVYFRNPENYAGWLEAHPDGWLISVDARGRPKLHHATCDHTHPDSTSSEKDLTGNPKHCALDCGVLVAWASHVGIVVEVPCHRPQCRTHPAAQRIITEWNAYLERREVRAAMDEEE
jgi:hypothetical protein